MKNVFTTKRLCRAGIIAALYVALTYAFGAIAYQGTLQIRPAEALTVLPLFYVEAVPALWIGCMLSNLASPFIIYDVPIGGLATLIAAVGTYLIGRFIKNNYRKISIGGLFPVIVNAFIIPIVIVFLCGDSENYSTLTIAYWAQFGSLCATEALWVYGLGVPLYIAIYNLRKKGVSAFIDGKKSPAPQTSSQTVVQSVSAQSATAKTQDNCQSVVAGINDNYQSVVVEPQEAAASALQVSAQPTDEEGQAVAQSKIKTQPQD